MPYIDTSVLAAYYCPETYSAKAQAVLSRGEPLLSLLTEVELVSAVSKKVRMKELSADSGRQILTLFQSHLDLKVFAKVVLDSRHYQLAAGWMARFNLSLRTLDALHLAVAAFEKVELATADKNLAKSARQLGIKTILVA